MNQIPSWRISGCLLGAWLAFSCGDKYEGPFTPGSPDYVGKEWARDSDNDGVADSLEKYQPGCRLPLRQCMENAKALSRIAGQPRSLTVHDLILWIGDTASDPRVEFSPKELKLGGLTLTSSDSERVRPRGQGLDALKKGFAQIDARINCDTVAFSFLVRVVEEGVPVRSISAADLESGAGKEPLADLRWEPSDATFKDYFLFSRNPEVARVVNNRIRTVQPGVAQIDVTSLDGGARASFSILVKPAAESVAVDSLSALDLYLVAGASVQAPRITWYPDSASDREYVLITGDSAIADVSAEKGKVKPRAPGTTLIQALSMDGGYRASFTAHVSAALIPLKGVSARNMILLPGASAQTPLVVFDPPDASDKGFELAGGDPKVAITTGGAIMAVAPGQATFTLTARDGQSAADFTVTVVTPDTAVHVDSVRAENLYLAMGTSARPILRFLPTNAPDLGYGMTRIAGISVEVDGDSLKAVAEGESEFRVTSRDSGRTVTFRVKVFKPVIPLEMVSAPPLLALALGDPDRIPTLTFAPTTATDTGYALISKDTAVVKVVGGTQVRAQGIGKAEVSVLASGGVATAFDVSVGKKAASSSDSVNALAGLSVSAGELDTTFQPGSTEFGLTVANDVSAMTITAILADPRAHLAINGMPMLSGSATTPMPLATGANLYSVQVTALNGSRRTFSLTITRERNADATLASLQVPDNTLIPVFAPATSAYSLNVENRVTSILLAARPSAPSARVTINGTLVRSGNLHRLAIPAVGETPVEIRVTAEDGTDSVYALKVVRAKSANADLAGITASVGKISPDFHADSTDYLLVVETAIASVSVTPVPADSTATIRVNNASVKPGFASPAVPLMLGMNSIAVAVTAAFGNTKTYSIGVRRLDSARTKAVAATDRSSLILKSDGRVWISPSGGLTLVETFFTDPDIPAPSITDISALATQGEARMVLKADEKPAQVVSCMSNFPQPGSGSRGQTCSLAAFSWSGQSASAIAAGVGHSLFLALDKTVWAIGGNASGQLGDGTTITRGIAVEITDSVKAIAAGENHSLFLKTDGTLWGTGDNFYGQLGDGTTTRRLSPVLILAGVASVAAGGNHTLLLKEDGVLWAVGRNDFGQLGDGDLEHRSTPVQVMNGVASMVAGGYHNLILKADGSLWAMGRNVDGQLGDGTTLNRPMPVQIMTDVSAMAAGKYHSLIIKTDGSLWATGRNENGQLGDGTKTNRSLPVRIDM